MGEGETGIEALDLVKQHRPDLVTLDIIMPEMDGIECYRKMRLLGGQTRCLLVSVLASEPRVVQAYEHEIFPSHFLKKPVNEKEFKERVEDLFKQDPLPVPTRKLESTGDITPPPLPL